jgi:hypothetical protein
MYQHLENHDLVNKVRVMSFVCRSGCKVATVVRVGDRTLARTKDHKKSPGFNADRTAPGARERNTLDGDRHWPGSTYDLDDLADGDLGLGFATNCRHQESAQLASEVLEAARKVTPGKPGAPRLLS